MEITKPISPEFLPLLELKSQAIIDLFTDLRAFILELHPQGNELLYHTHALTTAFSLSDKLGDAYCMIPIYTNHLNLGFTKGTLLKDPDNLLRGTGNLIRHLPVTKPGDYRNEAVRQLLLAALQLAVNDSTNPSKFAGATFSKIKKK